MRNVILIMLLPLILVCCKSKNDNGNVIQKWKNGNPRITMVYTNKPENSYVYTEYNENGTLKSISNYVKGKLDGSVKNFDTEGYLALEKRYRAGKLDAEFTYKFGKMNGPERIFHYNGQLWTERILLNGRPWKVVSNYDSLGRAMDPGTLNEGYGTIILYDKFGKQLEVRNYREGMQVVKSTNDSEKK